MTTDNKSPAKCECQGCTKRKLGCHSTCDSYKKYREYKDHILKLRQDERNLAPKYTRGLGRLY